jgi:hypothetical protein
MCLSPALFSGFCAALLLAVPVGALQLSGSDVSVTGNMQARWILGSAVSYAPYHSAIIFNMYPKVKIDDRLSMTYHLQAENPSISDGYGAKQRVAARGSVLMDRFGWRLRVGDLDKITLGNGLLIEGFESEGFMLTSTGNGWDTSLTYIAHGYSNLGDYAIASLEHDSHNLGGYVFSYIDDSAYFRTYANVFGIYGSWLLTPWVNVRSEVTIPFGIMILPTAAYRDANSSYQVGVTARYYTRSLNAAFQQYSLEKTYHGFEEEFEEYDNWRNYLLNSMGAPQDTKGIYAKVALERQLAGLLWQYGDLEIGREYYLNRNLDVVLFAVGFQIRLSPQERIYLGIQNKVLNSLGVIESQRGDGPPYRRDEFSSFDTAVLAQVQPFVVVGMKVEY